MDKQEELKELFSNWKELHGQEKENPGKKSTLPFCEGKEVPENFYISFCCDGFLTEDICSEKKTVLFLCREANVFEEGKLKPEMGEKFWMRDNVFRKKSNNEELCKKDKKAGEKYWSFLEKTIDYYCQCKPEELNIAYMNLNKRGGFGSCNQSRLKNYVRRYREEIKEEIKIIAPDWIICGGTYGIVTNKNYRLTDLDQENIKDEYHPSYRKLKMENI